MERDCVRQMQMVIMMMERDRVGWGWYIGQHDGGVDGTYTIGRDMVRMTMVNDEHADGGDATGHLE